MEAGVKNLVKIKEMGDYAMEAPTGKEGEMLGELRALQGVSTELDIIIENILYNRLYTLPQKL